MNFVKLTKDRLNIDEIYNLISAPEYGAINLFVGTTRNNFQGKTVSKLEYEAYKGMAVKSLENICNSIRQKYEVGNIAIYHRLGDVPVQEASVIIAISATHRKSVFEAVSFAIDILKAEVPIWKKEIYEGNNSPQWKENSESQDLSQNSITQNWDLLQLQEEIVETDTIDQLSSDMIQINTNLEEINRRMMSFISRKRQQMNVSNIQDFCMMSSDDGEDSTCARVNAILFRRKDSKTHFKVHRVENSTGPQMKTEEYKFATQFAQPIADIGKCPEGAEERLLNAEHYLNIKNDSPNVYSRLKAIEDRILYLESISPEYFDFAKMMNSNGKSSINFSLKRNYSSADIDSKIQHLESKFLRR